MEEIYQTTQGRDFIVLCIIGYFFFISMLCFVAAAERHIENDTTDPKE